jgi:ribose transport system substrate-binding protein
MQRLSRFTLVSSLAIAYALFAACGSPAKPEKAVKTVTIISNTASNFWKVIQKGAEKADAELADVNVIFKMTYGATVKEQERYTNESLVKDDADAIAISPLDPDGLKDFLDKTARKTTLITLDSDAPRSARAVYLGADNRAAGRQAADLLMKALPKGGKVMVFVGKRLENAQERLAGLREAVSGSKIEILDLMLDDNDISKARENATEALNKYPDLAGMVGLWSYNGPAIRQAVENADKLGKVKIVCFDDDHETLEGIKAGSIFGTVAQQPFEYGYETVKLASKILKGDKAAIPADKKVLIPTVVVQRNNVDEYKTKLEHLLGGK